uniref:Thioredoxin 2 n=1 Tax=Macaca nemestrina TaxID=9545 RepID=A0A2K6CUS9_MACNE
MAQRLLLRRFLASIISRNPSQGRWPPLTSRALPGGLTVTLNPARTIYTTRISLTTFNIQDGPDFQDRVVNSETPVVVDFHAHLPHKGLGVAVEKRSLPIHLDPLVLPTQVSAVPTVLAMKNGDVVDKFVGIKDEDQLEAFLKKLIG